MFLPVVPWRAEPEPERRPRAKPAGLAGFVRDRVARAADEAQDMWERMKAADEGTVKNRLYRLVGAGGGVLLPLRAGAGVCALAFSSCSSAISSRVCFDCCLPLQAAKPFAPIPALAPPPTPGPAHAGQHICGGAPHAGAAAQDHARADIPPLAGGGALGEGEQRRESMRAVAVGTFGHLWHWMLLTPSTRQLESSHPPGMLTPAPPLAPSPPAPPPPARSHLSS